MEQKIMNSLTEAFEKGNNVEVLRHAESLCVAIRSRLTLENIDKYYVEEKQEEKE